MPGIAVNSELDNLNASVTYPIWFTPESGDLGVNVPTLILSGAWKRGWAASTLSV